MPRTRVSSRRAGVLSSALIGVGLIALGTLGAASFRSAAPVGGGAPAIRPAEPHEVAALLGASGLNAEGMAAAGVSGLQCDAAFSAASAYCVQADRVGQLRLAAKNLNEAKARAVHAPVGGNGGGPAPQTVAEAQSALDEVTSGTFQFVTAGLDEGQIARLTKIKANTHWGLPAPYLTIDRTNPQWLALRGALANKRDAVQRGRTVIEPVVQVIADADSNETVAQAKSDLASKIAAVKQSWQEHSTP